MTTLKDLNKEELEVFQNTIADAVKRGLSSPKVQRSLHEDLGKLFGIRMINRYKEKYAAGRNVGPRKSKAQAEQEKMEGKVEFKGLGDETAELNTWIASERVVTLEDALTKGQVDLDKWDVDKWEVTSWEVGMKTDKQLKYNDNKQLQGVSQDSEVIPLWRVSVKLKAKKGWNPTEFKVLLMEDLRRLAPSYKKPSPREATPPILAELSIFDAHFGKLAWAPETQQDYDLKICRERYMNAGRDLLGRAAEHNPERVLMVVGNDFFHVDHKGLTTAGTPQDCDGRWQKAFRVGTQCCVTLAEEATQIAPVDILIVPGNHDSEKAFCLGEVLDARFHNNHEISVMNDPDKYKYYPWGKVLLGFVHGDKHMSQAKRADLPSQMLTDRPVECANSVWREWHLGHIHSEQEDVWKYRTVEHIRDMAIRHLPSLSSTDAWHREQGYVSVLAAECHLYHKDKGRWAYLNYCTEP